MPLDWGHVITVGIVLWIVGISYKKKTGQPISVLWKDWKKDKEIESPTEYRKVYITKGIKQ